MSDLDITGRVVFDASQAEGALDKIGDKADQMAREVQGAAVNAGKAVDKIGDGAAGSAEKFTRAEGRIADSIKRTQTGLEQLGKTASQKLEFKINAQGLDPAKFEPMLAKLREVEAQAIKGSKGFDSISDSADKATASIVSSFAAIAAGVSIGGLTALVKQGIDAADSFSKLSAKSGVAVESLRELNYAASLSDVSTENLATGLRKLSQNMAAAAGGGKEQAAAFSAVGVSFKNLDGSLKGADDTLKEIASKFANFKDGPEKAALAIELFGKQGAELIPLLNGGAAGLADMADEAKKLGIVFDGEFARNAEAFNDNITRIQTSAQGAALAIAQELLPTLNKLTQTIVDSDSGSQSFAATLGGSLRTVLESTVILASDVSFVLKGIGREIGAIAAQSVALATLDIKGFKAISEAVKEDGVRARAELDKFQSDLLNTRFLTSKAGGGRGTAADPRSLGIGDDSVSAPIVKSAIAGASALNAELKQQADLLAKLSGVNADYQSSLTRLQAIRATGVITEKQYVDLVKELIEKQPMVVGQRKKEEEVLNASAKALEAYVKEQLKGITAAEKSAQSAGATLQKYQDEEQALTLAAAKNISLAQAIAEVELARLRETQTKAIASNANQGVLLALDEEIKKREQIVQAIGRKESREAVDKSAKEAAADWKKAAEQIEQSITDALLRGFESGKGFGENLRDTLQNMFKTLVLRPVISAVVNPIAGQIASATGNGQGNFGGSNSPNFLSDFGGASAASYDKAGQWLINNSGTNQALGDFGSSLVSNSKQLGEYTKVIGDSMSYLEAASNFKDGSYGASIGQAAGTYFFGPIGGQIGKSIGEAVDKLFSPGEYVQSLGESVATITADKIVSLGGSGGNNDVSIGGGLNIRQTDQSDKFVNSLADTYLKATQALGLKSSATFGAGFNNSDGGKFAVEAAGANGQKYDPGQVKYTDENLKLEASRAVFFALQGSDLPAYLSKVFSGITASTAAQADIDAALNYAGSLKTIRDALTETREPLQILKDTIDASFKSLGTSADTFKADFVAAIDAGISPDKLSQFVALGQNLDALAQSSGTAAEAVRSLTDIANERKNLQSELDRLTLSGSELLAKQRDALDESNRALFDQVQAAQSAKDAQQELAAATEASAQRVSDAISGLSNTRFELENQLLTLQGNTGKVATRTRSNDLSKLTDGITSQSEIDRITASYDYNLSLTAQIDALTASKAAAEENARAQAQAQDAANRAAESAANAANKLRDAWQSVTDSIFDEVRRIRGLTGADSAQSYAQAQANFSITAAQAKAGDQEAAKALPELSKILLELADQNSISIAQLRFIQATTAGTLESIGNSFASQYGLDLPKLATGTNYIPKDGAYYLHEGESVVPVAYNPASGGQNTARLEALVEVLIARVSALEAPMSRTADASEDTASTLDGVTEGGNAMRSVVMEPIPT